MNRERIMIQLRRQLESRDFYETAQAYRHAPITPLDVPVAAFHLLQDLIINSVDALLSKEEFNEPGSPGAAAGVIDGQFEEVAERPAGTWRTSQPLDRELMQLLEITPHDDPWYARLDALAKLIMHERLQHAGKLAPAVKVPELREQRFQLNGDARLQFWRETYLAALPALIRACPHGGLLDGTWLRQCANAAATIADTALAAHLSRNDVEWPDSCVDLERQIAKNSGG